MFSIEKFLPRQLWQQIFLVLMALVIIPMTILGALLIATSTRILQETTQRNLKQIVLHGQGEVVKEFQGAVQVLDSTASILGILHLDRWRQETALVQLALKYPPLVRACSWDLNGGAAACSSPDETDVPAFDPSMRQCLVEQPYCVSEVRHDANELPVVDLAVGIYRLGELSGVLTATYSLRGIWSTIDRIQFGPESLAILVDEDGRILVHPDKKLIAKSDIFFDPAVISDLKNEVTSSRTIRDKLGRTWITAYSPIRGLRWGLIIAQPHEMAFAMGRVLVGQSWMLISLVTALAGLIGFWITRWVSQVMGEIIQATRKVARGDLSVSLPVERHDEFNRMKASFNHMTNRLKKAQEMEKLSMVGKSAASIAHEIKNSLVLVKSFIQMIPQRHQDKAFVKEAADSIVAELDGWNNMLKNMMQYSKSMEPLNLKPIDLNKLIEDAMLLLKLRAQERLIQVNVETKSVLPLIQADESQIKQVLLNLVSNALEATPDGGMIRVTSFTGGNNGHQVAGFEVFNSGEGIDPEHLEKVFEPFFTTKDHGLGLGLAISREIIHKHGGRMEARSLKGSGVTFQVTLPVYMKNINYQENHDLRKDRNR